MLQAEVWLRIHKVKGLGTRRALLVLQRLAGEGQYHAAALQNSGLTQQQIAEFLDTQYIDAALVWLEQPHHHLITSSPMIIPTIRYD